MAKETKEVKPFFARYLENMEEKELDAVKGGMTLKYPSDNDEMWP